MYRARDVATGAVLAERLRAAHTHWTRLKGLLGTRSLDCGDGLWLKPCNQVHMIGMRYAIDVVFLDEQCRVVGTASGLQPGKISPRIKEASSVLELPEGTLERAGVGAGVQIEIEGQLDRPSRVDAVGTLICNVLLAALFVAFAVAHFSVARRTGRWLTTMPLVVQEALLVVLFLTRRRSISTSARPFDWVVGGVGTFLPLLLRATDQPGPLSWLGGPLQVLGLSLAIVAIAFLGRSMGVVAANRGIQTAGLYRVVRHPIYASYLLSYVGYFISYPTWRNGLIAAVTLVALNARAIVEERLLAEDSYYRAYLRQVRWRFLPHVY